MLFISQVLVQIFNKHSENKKRKKCEVEKRAPWSIGKEKIASSSSPSEDNDDSALNFIISL